MQSTSSSVNNCKVSRYDISIFISNLEKIIKKKEKKMVDTLKNWHYGIASLAS